MPIHDWSRVDVGIFHAFHHSWIEEIARALNRGLLPAEYYALVEQYAAGFGPDVLTLQESRDSDADVPPPPSATVFVRHVSGDRIVAMVKVISPRNKAGRHGLRSLLDRGIHLLLLDLFPPGRRDPQGIHAEVWEEIAGQEYQLPQGRPLTFASYESGLSIRAYVVHAAVGDAVPCLPLFLESEKAIDAPLEATYNAAFAEVPRRWRRVLEAPPVAE